MTKKLRVKDIYLAQRRIKGLVRRTPLKYSPFFSEACEGEVYLKLENLQLTGAYKIRGALNKMLQLDDEERERGVVTASSGNHAQGIGYAAKMLDVKASIVVPSITPKTKIEAIKRYGVDLITYGRIFDESEVRAHELSEELSRTYISAYNDFDIIAGAGTVGLEMIEEEPDLEVILCPVGSGGLLSGISILFKVLSSDMEILGVQSEASPVMYESFKRGEYVEIPIEEMEESIAESLYGGFETGSITFDIVKELVSDIILTEEENIKKAISLFLEHHHQVAEGAGAVGLAALMEHKERFKGKKVGIIISGGNIDISLLRDILIDSSNA